MGLNTKENLLQKLNRLLEFCLKNNFNDLVKNFKPVIDYFENDTLNIIVLGEVKRGKSSFINSLIGRDILPIGPIPTTATINILKYSEKEEVKVYYIDGKIESLKMTDDVLDKYTAASDFKPDMIKYIEIYLEIDILKNNAVIIDTPGVNDICQTRVEITYGFLPLVDLAIFIFDSTQPLSKSESEFLKTQFIKKSNAKVIFSLGKSDRVSGCEIDDSIDCCRKRLRKVIDLTDGDPIIPFSTKLFAKDKSDNGNGFLTLKNKIYEYIDKTNRSNRRVELLNSTVDNFIEAINNEIMSRQNMLEMSIDEKRNVINNIKKEMDGKNSTFNNFNNYIAFIKSRIIKGAQKSFDTFSADLNQSLGHFVDIFQGTPKDLIEKHIPYQVRVSLKKWVDSHQPSLQKGLNIVLAQMINQYQKYFGKAKTMQKIMVNIECDDKFKFDEMTICDIDSMKKSMYLNSMIMGLAGTMLIGPLALPIAMLYNNYFGGSQIENKVSEIKHEIMNYLPQNIDNCLEEYKKTSFSNIDMFFNRVERFFKENFDSHLAEMINKMSDIDNNINKTRSDFEAIKLQLSKI